MYKEPGLETLDQFLEHLKRFGLRITPQRCAVYQELMACSSHPTADDVYQSVKKKVPNISYDTVNRTLLTFAEIGLVDVVQTKGGPRHFDPVMDNHHHFHCINCGKIIDFYSKEYDGLGVPHHIRDEHIVFSQRVVLNGLCSSCRRRKQRGTKGRDKKVLKGET